MPTLRCYRHPDQDAAGTCTRCLRQICTVCLVFNAGDQLCPECLAKVYRGQRIRRFAIGGVALVLATIGAAWAVRALRGTLPSTADGGEPFDYGSSAPKVEALRKRLSAEPCDRSAIIDYGELLIRAGDHRGALSTSHDFLARCGAYPRLLWVTYTAHLRLSEFADAESDATTLMDEDPSDKDYVIWRGQAFEAARDWDKAAADFEQAIALQPALKNIPLNLVEAYQHAGKPCDAYFALERYFQRYPEVSQIPRWESVAEKLSGDSTCRTLAGSGHALLHVASGGNEIPAEARINGHAGHFVVDTGASLVTLSTAFAKRAGVASLGNGTLVIHTANGTRKARLAVIDRVDVQGASAGGVRTALLDSLPPGIDGLLGMSFLSRFDLRLDGARHTLSLQPHGKPPSHPPR